jgi:hypothetical protein
MNERITTQHPAGKQGVNIDRNKYDQVREAILATLRKVDDMPLHKLPPAIAKKLPDFDGSISWYTTTIKLDLEARGLIERVPDSQPQRLRLAE